MAKFTNYSMSFDGVDADEINCGNDSSLLGSGDFTISTWIKISSFSSSWEGICGRGFIGATTGYGLFSNGSSSKLGFQVREGGNVQEIYTDNTVSLDTWYHFVGVRVSGGTSNIYLNGAVQVADFTESYTIALSLDFIIGHPKTGTLDVDGQVSDVAFWDSALDANTIASIYASGTPNDLTLAASYTSGGGTDKSGDLQGYWRCGEKATFDGSNWTVLDQSTNSNDGTSANMGIDTRIGDAPDSINNGLTLNMESDDRVTP